MAESAGSVIWDDIIKAGWGPGFAGAVILAWRRWPVPFEADARWYYRQIVEHASLEDEGHGRGEWTRALTELWEWLSPAEHARLKA